MCDNYYTSFLGGDHATVVMKVAAVVVTYNRLELLKESLVALKAQTHPPDRIYVVNNCSTDGTTEYLAAVADGVLVRSVELERNIGGAGGFSAGMRIAVEGGYDYVWVMDDDTIPAPAALENLLAASSVVDNFGFAVSKAVWIDGTPHKMNCPGLMAANRDRSWMFNDFSRPDLPVFRVVSATFVSMLVSAEAVRAVGLPIADFFIWADDIEFSGRIVAAGFVGLYVDNSVVIHKTPDNYFGHPQCTPVEGAWKFYYQARNTSYMRRKSGKLSKLLFLLKQLNRYRVYAHRINKRRDKNKKVFKRYIRKGLWDGIFFNPKIEKVK